MMREFVERLMMYSSRLDRAEIMQLIRMAEADHADDRLAFRCAMCDIIDGERKVESYRRRFLSLESGGLPALLEAVEDSDMARYVEEDEWHTLVASMPLPVRMLVHIANVECAAFAADPGWHLSKENRYLLLRQIRRRYIAWDRNHSAKSYRRAREALLKTLRRYRARRKR